MVNYTFNYVDEDGKIIYSFEREIPESVFEYIEYVKQHMIDQQYYVEQLEANVGLLSLFKIDPSQLN